MKCADRRYSHFLKYGIVEKRIETTIVLFFPEREQGFKIKLSYLFIRPKKRDLVGFHRQNLDYPGKGLFLSITHTCSDSFDVRIQCIKRLQ